MENSISIQHIGKCYKMYPSRRARLKEWLSPFHTNCHSEKWVLKDINLEVQPGEAVGIVGMNGAGKSTLLKIITGTTTPTTGTVQFGGRVAALLELGLGFHPDFTGRENVYMSGQLMGYSVDEINECMESIEQFAEIGDAINAPVRTYSSGMQVRLAFSVATMKRPDILIVDEALSVGDAYFQHKSFDRIKAFCDQGTTLLLVSHAAAAIEAVCDKVVLLDHGAVKKIGDPQEVMDYYNALMGGNEKKPVKQKKTATGHVQTISGNGAAKILTVKFLNEQGEEAELFRVGEHVRLVVHAETKQDVPDMTCGMMIKNRLGQAVFGTNTFDMRAKTKPRSLKAGMRVNYVFDFCLNIGEGNYSMTIALHSQYSHMIANYEWLDLAVVFQVVNQDKRTFEGIAYMDVDTTVKMQEAEGIQ